MVDYLKLNENEGLLAVEDNQVYRQINIFKTIDGGENFVPFSTISTAPLSLSYNFSLVKCGNGDILCFWSGSNPQTHQFSVCYNRSTDGGTTFSNYVKIDTNMVNSSGINGVVCGNQLFISYFGYDSTQNIFFKKSVDNGQTFSDPFELFDYQDDPTGYSPYPKIDYNPNVGVCVVWGQGRMYFRRSTDMGESFDSTIVLGKRGHLRYANSMVVNDSGEIFIANCISPVWRPNDSLVVTKFRLPRITNIKPAQTVLQNTFQVFPNYPNPFNPATTISFALSQSAPVKLVIYNVAGQVVNTLINKNMPAGRHQVKWNGTDSNQQPVASGIYMMQLVSGNHSQSRKMMLLR